jgi:meiotically up-regulated gene 157 (Mug157) protein
MSFSTRRPPVAERRFTSPAVETTIERIRSQVRDPELAWLFGNCFPNTLDTTVTRGKDARGREHTFVITGDIDAMWLRDSSAQVWPYLPLLREDETLRRLMAGVIHRQVACVHLDRYANAFLPTPDAQGQWRTDNTDMRPGVYERKYELDSLCSVLRLSIGYFRSSGDASCFDEDWRRAVELILQTIRVEQRGFEEAETSPYRFARRALRGTDTQPLVDGQCYPYRRCGMSRSPFRPSDDACQFAFPIAANAMAVVCLRDLASMWTQLGFPAAVATQAAQLASEIDAGIRQFGVQQHPVHGEIYAYEVDGFGSRLFMDDANIPSLLSLPYFGYCDPSDALYQRTRRYVLSSENPFYSAGRAGHGVGGPHIGVGWIWPMSIVMRALTSIDDQEIAECLRLLKSSHAGTGFMHESFWKDDAGQFTRSWFAWANALFAELILKLTRERPHLLTGP